MFPVGPKKEAKRAGGLANQNYTPSVIMAVSQRMRLIIRPNVLIGGRGEVVGGEIGWGREGGAIRRQHGQTDEILTTKPHIHTHTHTRPAMITPAKGKERLPASGHSHFLFTSVRPPPIPTTLIITVWSSHFNPRLEENDRDVTAGWSHDDTDGDVSGKASTWSFFLAADLWNDDKDNFLPSPLYFQNPAVLTAHNRSDHTDETF